MNARDALLRNVETGWSRSPNPDRVAIRIPVVRLGDCDQTVRIARHRRRDQAKIIRAAILVRIDEIFISRCSMRGPTRRDDVMRSHSVDATVIDQAIRRRAPNTVQDYVHLL